MMNMPTWRPVARRERLIVQELPGEVLVYDLERHKAHCLNGTAAAVWQRCDGRRSVAEIGQLLAGGPKAEELVQATVEELGRRNLLAGRMPKRLEVKSGVSRREWMKRAAMAAGVAAPVITTMVAPTAVQAGTCLPSGSGCTTGAQCCSGVCSAGTCL